MSYWRGISRFVVAAVLPLSAVACVANASSSGSGGGSYGGSNGTTTDNGAPSAHPILALVDTDQTMNAQPGQGVGVFAEYRSGGHWHVWWTCDTSVNPGQAPCAFDVKASVASGSIRNAASDRFEVNDSFTSDGQQVEGVTTTSTAVDGVTFDTDPGAIVTLSATIGGAYDGRFVFFVEQGQVDDGAKEPVTDPIQLQPTTP
jgi:hypothetical protein